MIKRIKQLALHIWRRLSLSGLVGVLVLFIVFSLVAGSVQAIQENFQRQLEVDKLRQEVALMKVEVETLQLQNQYYQTDEYLELQARDLLGLARPGEKVVILPPMKGAGSERQNQTAQGEVLLKNRSNFAQWLYFLLSDKRVNLEPPE